jgi:hypothetical protein
MREGAEDERYQLALSALKGSVLIRPLYSRRSGIRANKPTINPNSWFEGAKTSALETDHSPWTEMDVSREVAGDGLFMANPGHGDTPKCQCACKTDRYCWPYWLSGC